MDEMALPVLLIRLLKKVNFKRLRGEKIMIMLVKMTINFNFTREFNHYPCRTV